jgi:Zn-dependent M28 family amino/carboxypeptidase
MNPILSRAVAVLLVSTCSAAAVELGPPPAKAAVEAITAENLLRHIKVLADDEFEGRAPGSRGEELTVKYISEQFKAVGLKPGNPDGTYVQQVPLAGIKVTPNASFRVGEETMELKYPEEYIASSTRLQEQIEVENSDIVFVGYGVVAPEFGWDDYKDVDVRGKTILMLINDPAIPDPKNPGQLDPKMFGGRAMTYYGRWTYKYEIAAEKGAAAAVIIHETEPAAYPFSVLSNSAVTENFEINAADKNMQQVAVRSWVTVDTARKLLSASGQDFDALKKAALTKEFRPVPLGATANFQIKQEIRTFQSHNVFGLSEGTDPKVKDELIVYSAHWDHLGKDESLEGDQIYNGAIDNATGIAAIIEIARAHQKLPKGTRRSALFFATTAEESGLLGAKYYGENPLYPLEKTLGNINIDGLPVWGKSRDIEDVSDGNNTMADVLAAAAKRRDRVVKPNSAPERGTFYRADHFEFAKRGVPALYTKAGQEIIGKSPEFAKQKTEEYIANLYHQPGDEVDPNWDLSGAVADTQLLFEVGYAIANGNTWPEWKPGTEFKAKRDEMLARDR